MKIQHLKPALLMVLICASLPLLVGCRGMGPQRFTAFAPSQSRELIESSRFVLDVRCTSVIAQADYSLWENMHMLAPMPKRWKENLTLEVEGVVRGQFPQPTLRVRWLRRPTAEQCETLGIACFTNGMPLRVGFDALSGERVRNLKILIRRDE